MAIIKNDTGYDHVYWPLMRLLCMFGVCEMEKHSYSPAAFPIVKHIIPKHWVPLASMSMNREYLAIEPCRRQKDDP